MNKEGCYLIVLLSEFLSISTLVGDIQSGNCTFGCICDRYNFGKKEKKNCGLLFHVRLGQVKIRLVPHDIPSWARNM